MIVYDVNNVDTAHKIDKWKRAFTNTASDESVPIVLLGTKSDLACRVSPQIIEEEWIGSGEA